MENLMPAVKAIVSRIKDVESQQNKLAGFIRGTEHAKKLFQRVEKDGLKDLKVAAVDGGLLRKPLHGFDCIIVRAVGVMFHYKNGKIAGVQYWPAKYTAPEPKVFEALSELEWMHSASLERVKTEAQTSLECLGRFKPDMLLLDGPLVPHYSDRPNKGSEAYNVYKEIIELYRQLYGKSEESGIVLAGIVEDSRSSSFCEIMRSEIYGAGQKEELAILSKMRDTSLLYSILAEGERTKSFRYTETPDSHPIIKDLFPWGENVKSFYIKTAKYDRPFRADFIEKDGVNISDMLASILLALSGQHQAYGLPAPIIEADNAAALPEEEMEKFYSLVQSMIGHSAGFMKLRRENRPFK